MWTLEKAQTVWTAAAQRNWPEFLPYLADNVSWTISNDKVKSFPMAGTHNKQTFGKAVAELDNALKEHVNLELTNMFLSGRFWCFEARGTGDGRVRGQYQSLYCWVCELDGDGEDAKLKTVRCYLDSAAAKEIIETNA